MRANVFRDASSLRCFTASLPEYFGCDRLIGSPTVFRSRKQIALGVHPAPVLTKSIEQLRTERHVAVTVPFAMPDVDQHAHAIDILCLEMTQFGPAHAGRIQRHQ